MILRSITRHVREQNWFAVGIEVVREEIAAIHANTEVKQELHFHLSVLDANLGVMRTTSEITGQTVARLRASVGRQ